MGSNKVIEMKEGDKYGRWTVVRFSHKAPQSGNAHWIVKCECGTEKDVCGSKLRRGVTTQCKVCHGKEQSHHIVYKDSHDKDLYMVRVKGSGVVKIGSSSDVKERLRVLQVYNHEELELVGHWPKEGGREEEWHKELAHLQVRGEWFDLGSSCEL